MTCHVHFPDNVDTFTGLFNFFFFIIIEIQLRIKKQTEMFLEAFPYYWNIADVKVAWLVAIALREKKTTSWACFETSGSNIIFHW